MSLTGMLVVVLSFVSLSSIHLLRAVFSTLIPRTRKQWLANWTKRAYTGLIGTVAWVRSTQIVVTAGPDPHDQQLIQIGTFMVGRTTVWMANHSTDVDWLVYLWLLFADLSVIGGLLVVTKPQFHQFPILGKCLQLWDFPIVSKTIPLSASSYLSVAASSHDQSKAFSLLIFPEGQFIDKDTALASAKFAVQHHQVNFERVIHPRSKGTYEVVSNLHTIDPHLRLFDVTISFPCSRHSASQYPKDENSLRTHFANGSTSAKAHLHIRSWEVSNLPFTSATLATEEERLQVFDRWLRVTWGEKDQLLDQFYAEGTFDNGKEKVIQEKPRLRDLLALGSVILSTVLFCGVGWKAVLKVYHHVV